MRTIPYLGEGGQVVFTAPMAGLYRFTALGGNSTQFWATGGQVADLVNGSGARMFIVQMAQGDELFHAHDACSLIGSREPDEVPPEEP